MLAVSGAPVARAHARHSDAWAREHFAAAEQTREALRAKPAADRSRRDYQRVLNAFRNIYLQAPGCSKADSSVAAVAETLVEMGRHFEDDKILRQAVEQYKFLRREYPGSKFRFDGLFTIGEIYKNDLNDSAAARTALQDFLRRYPGNRRAPEARQAIAELDQKAKAGKSAAAHQTAAEKLPGKNVKTARTAAEPDVASKDGGDVGDNPANHRSAKGEFSNPPGRIPARVTGIRHWSTSEYSRVAIDVESKVEFSSQRVASPSRILLNLPNTDLAAVLANKSFDVNDSFLKKIRLVQFAQDRTQVVLEVDNLSDYDAFFLPNPSRLIIDIHGKNEQPAKESIGTGTAGSLKPDQDPGIDSSSSVARTAELNVRAMIGKTTPPGPQAGDGEVEPQPKASRTEKKLQKTIVKKIVEADDEDETPATSSKTAKLETARPKPVAAPRPDSNPADLQQAESHQTSSPRTSSQPASSHQPAPEKLPASADNRIHEARPTANGDRSLIRALGLKIGKIVIDPGHGGHDTGTIGPNGLEEKDLVLEVARRLGKLLSARLGAEVVYTRQDDTFIPLETRTAIANKARADLFVSIHANSSHDTAARGVETYYLNFTSSPEALEVAARENAVSEKSIYELQDLVKKIALKDKIEESREFAWDVQQSLHSGLAVKSPAIRDRGVKKAPFIVLIGANMPSILAEISFVSNPTDEHRLATSDYRQRIAESLYRGIAKYVNGLSGVKVASKMEKTGVNR